MESTPADAPGASGFAPGSTAPSPSERGAGQESALHPRPPTPPEPSRPRWEPNNLTLRLLTAALLIPLVAWVCYVGGVAFVAVIVGINCIAVNEFYSFISEKGANPHRLLGTLAAAAIPLIVFVGDAFYATSFMTAVLLTTMLLQLTKREIREAIASVSATFFGVFYVGWLMGHAVSVRFIYDDLVRRYGSVAEAQVSPEIGFFFMLLCLGGALGCDAGAYFVGRKYGRRRLAPTISPSKSLEGALGGVVVGGISAVLMKLLFDNVIPGELSRDFSVASAAVFGTSVAAVGILGDLIESLLKRDASLKEAGQLLPGVGGFLDRIDSALLAFPVMYYMLLAYYFVRFGP